MTNPAPHCNPTSRPAASILGRGAPLPSLADNECRPLTCVLEPRLASAAHMRLTDRIEGAPAQVLGLFGRQMFARPPPRREEAYDCAASALNPCACSTARNVAARDSPPSVVVPPRQFHAQPAAPIGLHRAATPDELAQHRVIHRTPVKNRIRIRRHCPGLGRSGHDRTCVGAPFGRLRARGFRHPPSG